MQATQTEPNLTRGYSIALTSSIVLSTTGILIRYLTQTYQLPSLILAFWRELFVVVSLFVLLALFRPVLLRVKRQHLRYLVVYGFVLAMFNSFWTLSVSLNGAAVATVLAYSSAGFTVLLGWAFLQERIGKVKMLAVVLSIGGCVLVVGALDPEVWRTNLIGIVAGIFSGVFYSVYSLLGRSASQRGLNAWSTLLYIFGFGSIFLLSVNLVSNGFFPGSATHPGELLWLGNALTGWGILLLLAVGPTLFGYGLYNMSLGYLPSSIAHLILTTEPVFTAVIAFFFLGEILTGVQIGGSVMIMCGVIFLRIYGD
ncbi:MAG: DMT family transporter [Chloroflexi bacterium]|nr:MAG: DMT family transporter [Chloroflexota bacterium]